MSLKLVSALPYRKPGLEPAGLPIAQPAPQWLRIQQQFDAEVRGAVPLPS